MGRKTATEGHLEPRGKRQAHCEWRSLARKFQLSLRRHKYAAWQGIITSCIIRVIQKEGMRPKKIAVSYVKGPISFFMLLKITQEGGRGGGKPLSLHTAEGLISKKHALSAALNRSEDSTCISGFQIFPLLVCISVS